MPAFRGINLRSGDLAEQLGLLMLQSVALVAPVPRTEDVGIDAVVTLIKKYNSNKYIAEDSFLVQIKSASIDVVSFKDEEVKWLSDLHLPLFIASVDRKTLTIKLYSTHSLSDALVTHPERTEINLELFKVYDGDITNSESSINLAIGPPVIEWSFDTIESNQNFIDEFCILMKTHIALTKKSIETRRVGFVDLATWNTGLPPKVDGSKMKPVKNEVTVEETTAPYFTTVINRLVFGDDLFTIRSLYELLDKVLEQKGHFEVINGNRQLIKWTAPHVSKTK